MIKPLDSPAFLRYISFISCGSKFERIALSRLLYFLERNTIFYTDQIDFRPGRSTLDQMLYLFNPFWMDLTNPSPALGKSLLLSTSLKLLTLCGFLLSSTNLFVFAFLLAIFNVLNPIFCDRRACVVYQNHASRSFCVRLGVLQGFVFGGVLLSLFLNVLPAFLYTSVSCYFYANNLVI